jgi:hypothetical protein
MGNHGLPRTTPTSQVRLAPCSGSTAGEWKACPGVQWGRESSSDAQRSFRGVGNEHPLLAPTR